MSDSRLYKILNNIAERIAGTKTANQVFASKNGSDGPTGFRYLVNRDLPATIVISDEFNKDNITVTADSTSTAQTISIAKADYVPLIAVTRIVNATNSGVNSSTCFTPGGRIDGDNYVFQIRNTGYSDAKVRVFVRVLYKSSYLRS